MYCVRMGGPMDDNDKDNPDDDGTAVIPAASADVAVIFVVEVVAQVALVELVVYD